MVKRQPVRSMPGTISRRSVLASGAAATAVSTLPAKAQTQSDGSVYDVIVIGAGLAGLTAARDLQNAGVKSFRVLEARDRVGGRTLNQDLGRGTTVEGGGQWVGPSQHAILELARDLGVETFPTYNEGKLSLLINGDSTEIDANNNVVANPDFVDRLNKLALSIPVAAPWKSSQASNYDSMTFREWLVTQKLSEEDQVAIDASTYLTFGAPPDAISFLYVLYYIRSAGGYDRLESIQGGAQQDRIAGGSQILSLKMFDAIRDHVQLSAPVKKIINWEASTDTCRVITDAEVFQAKQVILALSPALCNQIVFDSPLPPKRADLHRTWPVVGSGLKAQVRYREPFWREKGFSGQSFTDTGPYIWSIDNSPPDGSSGVLLCFVDLDAAPRDPESRKLQITEAYTTCFGEEASKPLGYVEMNWSEETWTKGCVSPLAPGQLSTLGAALRPSLGRLHWSGTETSIFWTGYMDGAVRSGHAAALNALGALTNAPTVPG